MERTKKVIIPKWLLIIQRPTEELIHRAKEYKKRTGICDILIIGEGENRELVFRTEEEAEIFIEDDAPSPPMCLVFLSMEIHREFPIHNFGIFEPCN